MRTYKQIGFNVNPLLNKLTKEKYPLDLSRHQGASLRYVQQEEIQQVWKGQLPGSHDSRCLVKVQMAFSMRINGYSPLLVGEAQQLPA